MSDRPKGFLRGIILSHFMDVYQEWHAFVEGISEGFCIMRQHWDPSGELRADLVGDHHYYAAGRVVGRVSLIVLVAGMIVWIIGVI